jgi:hypothetical protein
MHRDQVWVSVVAKAPYVLRPTGNGQYRLVGEAYMDVIMYGELVEERRSYVLN